MKNRVSWDQLLAYGMGGIVPVALFNVAGQLMALLGNISLGLSAFWLGTIMIIPRLWDAVSDPIVGVMSDNTRSRWGRRRPYILVGGITVAITFVLMWWIPRGDGVQEFFATESSYNWFQLSFILAALLAFYTACTVFEIPHGALGMELSSDYHERTLLFSAKSLLGNLFAMGTPWLIALSDLEMFRGPGGDLVDGMRYVSLFIAGWLLLMVWWWFLVLREPGFEIAKQQAKSSLRENLTYTLTNKTFLSLVIIIFTLAMGFNFVSIFENYIVIFYIFEGDTGDAGKLLGIKGTVWAVTGMLAVFPLNWISRRIGKNKTLLLAILLMCCAQIAKIFCYSPEFPYLILFPTVLLSSGMLMFFTLGSSMVADVCDEDELHTGTRSEGSYYSVFWWFIKMGTAFASFVTGALLVYTSFDEKQNVLIDAFRGELEVLATEVEDWDAAPANNESLQEHLLLAATKLEEYRTLFGSQSPTELGLTAHSTQLQSTSDQLLAEIKQLQKEADQLIGQPTLLTQQIEELLERSQPLRRQAPTTLFRMRLVEIGIPLVLSCISILLTLRYPLTEERCREIEQLLTERRGES